MHRQPNTAISAWSFVAALFTAAFTSTLAPAAAAEPREWCAAELEALTPDVCVFAPDSGPSPTPGRTPSSSPSPSPGETSQPRTLVLFLHSLVAVKSDWQWEQQRLIARAGAKHHFHALMPRGRTGIGPGRAPDVWAWPTSKRAQEEVEDELIAEWARARETLEQRLGQPFERLLVFGFSNGAYYASSLALRGRLDAQGYGVFAGGSGGRYGAYVGSRTTRRAPIFVGYGTRDKARKDMAGLTHTLKQLGWPHRIKVEHVGHVVTDSQIAGAFRFLATDTNEPI